jgi:tetratricopeptide (TPR) repeat protein
MNILKKYRLTLIALIGFIISMTAQSQESTGLCSQGWSSYQSGQYDQALSLYDNCMKTGNLSQGNLARTYRNIGIAYNAKKDTARAIASYNQALALNPLDPWNDHVNRGNAWSAAGDYDKALADYETALQVKPNFNNAYFNRGIVYERLGKTEKAKADISLAYENGLRTQQIIERMAYYQLPTSSAEKLDPNKPIESTEILSGVLLQLVTTANGKITCFEKDLTLADVRPAVQSELRRSGVPAPTANQVARVFYTMYPCPFSPNRPQLQTAIQKDLEGAWLYPESSQKYRFPPQSPAWQQARALPIKCEGLGFYTEGEMRTTRIAGTQAACTFRNANDLEAIRRFPRVASWSLIREGRLNVSRTDVSNHIEEWDMFVATADFEAKGLQVRKGDLIGYLRKERGNDWNIAATFWHLQKLPQ